VVRPWAKERRVSFQSREKKRRYKRAVKSSKRGRSEESAKRWFLTLAAKPGRCAVCRQRVRKGQEIVYRHEDRQQRCVRCGAGLAWRPSLRWEKERRKRSKQSEFVGGTNVLHRP
jgi:hypothetical protein